jgi:hypothetical protein
LTEHVERSVKGIAHAELHVLAYLAALLSVYAGRPPDAWEYDFTATPSGAPYSHALASEIDRLRASGLIADRGLVLSMTELGTDTLRALSRFESCTERSAFVEAAAACVNFIPIAGVSDALTYEPQLQRVVTFAGSRRLFDHSGIILLSAHFHAVREAIDERRGPSQDLLVPAIVWLTYLSQVATKSMESDG